MFSSDLLSVLRVAGRVDESIVDGPGLRFVLFLQGCGHGCLGCHNPETHDPTAGMEVSAEEIWTVIKKNSLLQGITFSGGEPFLQAKALLPLARFLRAQGYHIMVYTGYLWEQLLLDAEYLALLQHVDLLVDGPYLQAKASLDLPFRGSSNQRIIRVQESLFGCELRLWEARRWGDGADIVGA